MRTAHILASRLWLFLLAALLVGCAPTDPIDTKIKANTGASFLMWRGKIEPRLSPAERAELVETIQELKLAVMGEAGNTPVGDLDARVRTRIHGLTLREAYVEACRARLERLAPEREALETALAHNRHVEGANQISADYIAVRIERQTERIAAIIAETRNTEARLRELDAAR